MGGSVNSEVIAGLHLIGPQVLVSLAMNMVSTRFSNYVNNARIRPHVRHEEPVVNFKLIDGARIDIQRCVSCPAGHRLNTVDEIHRVVGLVAGYVDGEQWMPGLVRRAGSGSLRSNGGP